MKLRPVHEFRSRTLGLALVIASALASPIAHAFDIPELAQPVVDAAGILDATSKAELDQRLIELDRRGLFQMAIYLPRSLEGADIESYSMAVAEKWKLGKKGVDRGLLLIVAPAERRMRLEVGYGLEGTVPDAVARRILDETLRPRLREGNPALGLDETVTRLERIVGGDASALPAEPEPNPRAAPGQFSSTIAFFLLFVAVVLRVLLLSRRHIRSRFNGVIGPSWWGGRPSGNFEPFDHGSGGGFGGGYGGHGGGFGGGGASSSW